MPPATHSGGLARAWSLLRDTFEVVASASVVDDCSENNWLQRGWTAVQMETPRCPYVKLPQHARCQCLRFQLLSVTLESGVSVGVCLKNVCKALRARNGWFVGVRPPYRGTVRLIVLGRSSGTCVAALLQLYSCCKSMMHGVVRRVANMRAEHLVLLLYH